MTPRILALVALALVSADSPPGPYVTMEGKKGGPLVVELAGLTPALLKTLTEARGPGGEWARVLAVHALPAAEAKGADPTRERPTLSGRYEVRPDRIRFQSRYPVEAGQVYFATFVHGKDGTTRRRLDVPADTTPAPPTTVVTRVSPSGDVLPENLLRFYLEFSAPMSRGEAYEHVRLLDGAGKPIDLPFLELGEELWDRRGVRLTLLFDPGRIKTGLRPRDEAGPVLEAGKSYTFVVDAGWRDAEGRPLKQGFRKPFRAGPADLTPPDTKNWRLDTPAAGSRGRLVVTFPEPLDRAMLARVLAVTGPDGRALPGAVRVGDDETSWAFTPETPWSPGPHALVVDRDLEDRVGNSIGRPFEVDVFNKVDDRPALETVSVPFVVRP